LHGIITVTFLGTPRNDLTSVHLQNGHRHMPTIILKDAGHAEFLGNYTGTHLFTR
jgi:hypothetical protein